MEVYNLVLGDTVRQSFMRVLLRLRDSGVRTTIPTLQAINGDLVVHWPNDPLELHITARGATCTIHLPGGQLSIDPREDEELDRLVACMKKCD